MQRETRIHGSTHQKTWFRGGEKKKISRKRTCKKGPILVEKSRGRTVAQGPETPKTNLPSGPDLGLQDETGVGRTAGEREEQPVTSRLAANARESKKKRGETAVYVERRGCRPEKEKHEPGRGRSLVPHQKKVSLGGKGHFSKKTQMQTRNTTKVGKLKTGQTWGGLREGRKGGTPGHGKEVDDPKGTAGNEPHQTQKTTVRGSKVGHGPFFL